MKYTQGINHFIVKVGSSGFDEEYKLKNGVTLQRSPKFNDVDNAKKSGEILATPQTAPNIPVGATLHFNHIITKASQYSQGNCIDEKEGVYKVPYVKGGGVNSFAYAYEYNNEVIALDDWVFIKPIYEELKTTDSGLVIVESMGDNFYSSGEQKPKPLHGEVKYKGDSFFDWDFDIGDVIVAKQGHEYEMEIKGETLYRVWRKFVLAKVA